jgi:hypothetical protein
MHEQENVSFQLSLGLCLCQYFFQTFEHSFVEQQIEGNSKVHHSHLKLIIFWALKVLSVNMNTNIYFAHLGSLRTNLELLKNQSKRYDY